MRRITKMRLTWTIAHNHRLSRAERKTIVRESLDKGRDPDWTRGYARARAHYLNEKRDLAAGREDEGWHDGADEARTP